MYTDKHMEKKQHLKARFAGTFYAALREPAFTGSREPILLGTTYKPFSGTSVGPRSMVLRVNAGLHGQRLHQACTRTNSANLRALVPWRFTQPPQIYWDGATLCIEIPWPDELYNKDVFLHDLEPQSSSGKAATIGVNSRGETVTLAPDRNAPTILIGGRTRSGKSTTIQTMVSQFARDETASFVFIDGKDGDGLDPLDGIQGQVGPIAKSLADARRAAFWSVAEMKRRNAMPRSEKQNLSRIFIIIDEFDTFAMVDADFAHAMFLLAKQCGTAEIICIAGTQSPKSDMFGGEKGTKGQYVYRIAHPVSNVHESIAIIDHPEPRADYLDVRGAAYVIAPGHVYNTQVAQRTSEELESIRGHAPTFTRWPETSLDILNEDNDGRAVPFTNEETVVALYAAINKWGRWKVNEAMKSVLGYGMGADRIDERLLPFAGEMAQIWTKLEEL